LQIQFIIYFFSYIIAHKTQATTYHHIINQLLPYQLIIILSYKFIDVWLTYGFLSFLSRQD